MTEATAFEHHLEAQGFTRTRPEGGPEELRWYHKPPNWRERLPVVRGYRRTVVIVDLPVVRPERIEALFGETARVTASGLGERLADELSRSQPWYAYPLFAITLVVAVVLTYFVGISIELQNQDWVVVVFRGDQLSPGARDAVPQAYGAGEGFTAVAALWDPASGRLQLPAPPPARWGQHQASAKAALKDMRTQLTGRGDPRA